ncbi:TIGR04255 family protein [Pelagibius sp.]|uniref:TIGR04255 family protein n=1 Tax=Pelagibius sp. TaxID=1931238 RepID=UPI003B4FFFEB
MGRIQEDPLFGPAPQQIPLLNAPLTTVLCQVRFTHVFAASNQSSIADFHERIRNEFPIAKEEQNISLQVSGSVPQAKVTPVWRFEDDLRKWRVSLTTDFMSLETKAYESRQDFNDRLGFLLKVVSNVFSPSRVTRVGVRYVDHIKDEPLTRLGDLVRPELVGFSTSELHEHLVRSLNETLCEVEEGYLLVRWGLMQENATHDAVMMPAVPEKSWMLDLDAYKEFPDQQTPFNGEEVQGVALALATRVYAFFRWAVKDEFLRTYGGDA